jgi:hypothetical protein
MVYKNFENNPPIVFLDTNTVIEMANGLLLGEKSHRGLILFNFLTDKVKHNKIICPFVFQRDEYFTYFDKRKNKKCDDVLIALSKGKQVIIATEKIFEAQFKRMASLYLGNPENHESAEFFCNTNDIFDARCNSKSKLEKSFGIKIVVLISGFLLPNQKQIDQNLLKLLQKRRKEIRLNNLNKEQVFWQEKRGRLYDLVENDEDRVKRYKTEIDPTGGFFGEESLRMTKNNVLRYWKDALGKQALSEDDFKKMGGFINSEFFFSIPIDYISSILFTELLLDEWDIKITDNKDIESLSFIFPYCSFALVDNAMNSYLHKTGLSKTFNVSVFPLKSTEKLIEAIDGL